MRLPPTLLGSRGSGEPRVGTVTCRPGRLADVVSHLRAVNADGAFSGKLAFAKHTELPEFNSPGESAVVKEPEFLEFREGPVGEAAGEDRPLAHAARDPRLKVCTEGGCASPPPSSRKPRRIPQTLLCPATLSTSQTPRERACVSQSHHPAQLEWKPILGEGKPRAVPAPLRPSPQDASNHTRPSLASTSPQRRIGSHSTHPWGQRSFPTRQDFLGFMPLCGASVPCSLVTMPGAQRGRSVCSLPPRTAGLPPVWARVGETTDVRAQAPMGTSGISVPGPNRWVTCEQHTPFFLSFYKNKAANRPIWVMCSRRAPTPRPGPRSSPAVPSLVEDVPESFHWVFSLRPPSGTDRTSFLFIPRGRFHR